MKKKLLQVLGYLGVGILIMAIPFVWATVVKDPMTFEGPLTIKAAVTQTGNTTLTGNITQTGNQSVTGTIAGTAIKGGIATLAYTNKSGLVVTGTEGNILLANTGLATEIPGLCQGPGDSAGVTVVLPVPTTALEGYEYTIIKSDSGATDIFLYVLGGLPIGIASSTTDNLTIDSQGDAVTVVADYDSAVSYWIKASRIQ